jgi:hypothetical protein
MRYVRKLFQTELYSQDAKNWPICILCYVQKMCEELFLLKMFFCLSFNTHLLIYKDTHKN